MTADLELRWGPLGAWMVAIFLFAFRICWDIMLSTMDSIASELPWSESLTRS